MSLLAPFPWFGGKRDVAEVIWSRFGRVKQYIEPFCGSAAVLLAAPAPASLEVVNDINGFIANFWRAVKSQPAAVAHWADYPVSHIDLGARHGWLLDQRASIAEALQDPNWSGNAQAAGWWLWGQCTWIGGGWCDWTREHALRDESAPGLQAIGQIPHAGNAGRGVQAIGQIPFISETGRGVQAPGRVTRSDAPASAELITSSGRVAWVWLRKLADRLERVRVIHGSWERCLNNHYGAESTAVFLDPPYRAYETVYAGCSAPVADAVADWARTRGADMRIALCGHVGDYDLPGWDCERWKRSRFTYGSGKTTGKEAIWFSPACLSTAQGRLFDAVEVER